MPTNTTAATRATAQTATKTIRVSYDEKGKKVITSPPSPIKLKSDESLTFVSDEGYDLHIGLDPSTAFSRPSFHSGEGPVQVLKVAKNQKGMFWCGWTEVSDRGVQGGKPVSHGWPHNKLYGAGTDIGR